MAGFLSFLWLYNVSLHIWWNIMWYMGFPHSSVGKESACNAGNPVQFLGWEDPLEKEMATHSSTLARKIPWMEKPGRLQSMGWHRVRHDWVTLLSLYHPRQGQWWLSWWSISGDKEGCLGDRDDGIWSLMKQRLGKRQRQKRFPGFWHESLHNWCMPSLVWRKPEEGHI